MTTEIDWDNAPEDAEFYAFGEFKRINDCADVSTFAFGKWMRSCYNLNQCKLSKDYQERPQPKLKYEYGVEYPTNGQKPDLPDDVVVGRVHYTGRWFGEGTVKETAWHLIKSFRIVDERHKPAETAQEEPKPQNQYQRTIIGLDGSKCVVDVYRILDAFKTDSPALDHAIKKILCPGTRHQKDREQDLKEAIKSIEAELLLMSQR